MLTCMHGLGRICTRTPHARHSRLHMHMHMHSHGHSSSRSNHTQEIQHKATVGGLALRHCLVLLDTRPQRHSSPSREPRIGHRRGVVVIRVGLIGLPLLRRVAKVGRLRVLRVGERLAALQWWHRPLHKEAEARCRHRYALAQRRGQRRWARGALAEQQAALAAEREASRERSADEQRRGWVMLSQGSRLQRMRSARVTITRLATLAEEPSAASGVVAPGA